MLCTLVCDLTRLFCLQQRGKTGVRINGDGHVEERGDDEENDEEENFEERRGRMTSRAVPLSPNRGR